MQNDEHTRNLKEYAGWIHTMKNNPPWADREKTPAQKVQGVTHPLGESVGSAVLEQLVKTVPKAGKAAAYGLNGTGLLWNVFGDPDAVW